jgi:predicted ArsR family transcriptional regulator
MPDLRASQIETLRLVKQREQHGVGLSAAVLAANLGISESAADRRLLRLAEADALWWDGAFGVDGGRVYISRSTHRLTNQGRTALEEAGNG